MRFLIALIIAAVLIVLCAKPLKRYPVAFYLTSIVLVTLYFWGTAANVTGGLWSYFMPLMQRCAIAFLLFSAVMFVGVLNDSSRIRSWLMPIRRQLSILGCIFACGHIVFYAQAYLPRISTGLSSSLAFSLSIAGIITTLMIVLGITSFLAVKRTMKASNWKNIQMLAYPFYLLTYVHLSILLIPAVTVGNQTAIISMSVYSIIFVSYVVLRIRKALFKKNPAKSDTENNVSLKGFGQ